MKRTLVLLVLIWPFILFSQEQTIVSLEQCLKQTSHHYPLADQKELLKTANDLKQQIIKSGFLPKFVLNGQISYQSEVPGFPIELPNIDIPRINKDWYKMNVDISQLVYDGGVLKKQEELSQSSTNIEVQAIEIELFKVKELVKTAYFNVMLLDENKKTLLIFQEELNEKLKSIKSAVSNGILQPSSKDNLMAEIIKIEQNIFELEIGIETAISSLNILTGLQLTPKNVFVKPILVEVLSEENFRPEMTLFDLQISKVHVLKQMSTLKRKPVILAFGQAGYGRPGLNMLSNDFEPYFIVGAKLKWNILDWGNTNKEKKSLDLQSQMIQKTKETFNLNLNVLLVKKKNEIKSLKSLIDKDEQIVKLKRKVSQAASSQFENGIITATEYLLEKNAETKAIMNYHLHKLQLLNAQIDYEFSLGNFNE